MHRDSAGVKDAADALLKHIHPVSPMCWGAWEVWSEEW